MAIDSSIKDRLSRLRDRNRKKKPLKKSKSLGRKALDAAKTVETFIILNHIKEGRIALALGSIAARVFSGMLFRPSKKLPKRKSVLARRRKSRKKNIAKFRVQPSRRSSRRRVPEARRTLI